MTITMSTILYFHVRRSFNRKVNSTFLIYCFWRVEHHFTSLFSCQRKKPLQNAIACFCYHYHKTTAPSYVTDMLHKNQSHTCNTRSSSYTMPLLNFPAHRKATLGDRSFAFPSSSLLNTIPHDVSCAPSMSSAMSRLKTYLFHLVFVDWTLSLISVHMCMS